LFSEKHQLIEKCEHKFYSKIFGSNTAANNLNRNKFTSRFAILQFKTQRPKTSQAIS